MIDPARVPGFLLVQRRIAIDCYFAAETVEKKFKVPKFEEAGSLAVRRYVKQVASSHSGLK